MTNERSVPWNVVGSLGASCALAAIAWGCSSAPPPPPSSPETYARNVKASVYEFCFLARQQGVRGASAELSTALENVEGYEEQHLGDHYGKYQQIVEKLKALKQQLSGTMNNQQLKTSIDEIEALANDLPGEASKKPAPPSRD
jgi:hypothetical protein